MSDRRSCVLASGNQGKLVELAGALAPHNIHLIPQSEFQVTEADESAVTFIENALIKARHASLATGLPALADDSGLTVPVLGGAPGIYSARYSLMNCGASINDEALYKNGAPVDSEPQSDQKPSDSDNMTRLLFELKNYSGEQRAARFVCVLAYLEHADDPEPIIATGYWSGRITESIESEGGFGYDPIFFCTQTGMTAAAMGKQRKSTVSHRGAAIRDLQQQLLQRSR